MNSSLKKIMRMSPLGKSALFALNNTSIGCALGHLEQ